MRITRCDGCGLEAAQQALARLKGWAGVRITHRASHPLHSDIETSQLHVYEVCADCLTKVRALLGEES